jgi:hypothetical protein
MARWGINTDEKILKRIAHKYGKMETDIGEKIILKGTT